MRHIQPTITGMVQPITNCIVCRNQPDSFYGTAFAQYQLLYSRFQCCTCYHWNALGTRSTTDGTIPVNSNNPFLSECLKRDECQKSPMKICLVVSPPSNKLLQVRQNFLSSTHAYTRYTNTTFRHRYGECEPHTNMTTLNTTGNRSHFDRLDRPDEVRCDFVCLLQPYLENGSYDFLHSALKLKVVVVRWHRA